MNEQTNVNFVAMGDKLRQARLQLGLTQGQAAEALSLSESYYSRIECGSRVLGVESLVAVANYYGLSLDYLLMDSTHADSDNKLASEIDNAFRGKTPTQAALLLSLLKMHAKNIDDLTP